MTRLARLALLVLAPTVALFAHAAATATPVASAHVDTSATHAAAPSHSTAAFQLDTLLAHLARPAPASTPFIEAHFSALLTRPLVVSGELEYLGPGDLARTVEKPYRERAAINGDTVTLERDGEAIQHFSLDRAPAMRSLLASFTALLGGDAGALERQFALDLHGNAREWTIGLTPRDPAVHQRIRSITVSGNGDDLRCLTTFQANDDVTVTLLSAAARSRVPAMPTRAWFDDQCRGHGG
jgi:Outer membrane lipoprotein carrier protein LolA-like